MPLFFNILLTALLYSYRQHTNMVTLQHIQNKDCLLLDTQLHHHRVPPNPHRNLEHPSLGQGTHTESSPSQSRRCYPTKSTTTSTTWCHSNSLLFTLLTHTPLIPATPHTHSPHPCNTSHSLRNLHLTKDIMTRINSASPFTHTHTHTILWFTASLIMSLTLTLIHTHTHNAHTNIHSQH